jgi:hypothetical protein
VNRDSKRHAQRGRSLGKCPDCGQDMWQGQKTINLPVKINGKWHGVLVHQACADKDL